MRGKIYRWSLQYCRPKSAYDVCMWQVVINMLVHPTINTTLSVRLFHCISMRAEHGRLRYWGRATLVDIIVCMWLVMWAVTENSIAVHVVRVVIIRVIVSLYILHTQAGQGQNI